MNTDGIRGNRTLPQAGITFATVAALVASPAALADRESRYQQHNLVSDGSVAADHIDANLVNAWGIAFNQFGPVWISDNGSGFSTVYNGAGVHLLQVTIPSPTDPLGGGNPTGIVFNGNANTFPVPSPGSGFARFIFATEDGVIAVWNSGANAILKVDNSSSGAVYKGLALGAGGSGALLYATDFHNNRIDVWDGNWNVVTPAGGFTDPKIPKGFAPFGIQAINGNIYVTYAKQDADAHDDVKGKGLGYVDVYDPNGNLLDRVASKGALNAPWGLALAPAGFGDFSNSLLVGNFGDGHINGFDVATGQFLGQLKDMNRKPVAIDGLWGIAFGNGYNGQSVNTLYFTAGPNDEANGLYGSLDAMPHDDHGPH